MTEIDDWMTTVEVAAQLHVQVGTVWAWYKRGHLKAEKRGRDLWLRRRDVEAFAAVPRRSGRPKRDATAGSE